ncbi:MAG: hypothetical protein AB1938_12205 [Myxococcota bacterium]
MRLLWILAVALVVAEAQAQSPSDSREVPCDSPLALRWSAGLPQGASP